MRAAGVLAAGVRADPSVDRVTRDVRRFARIYYDDFIAEYPDVYRDDRAFAAWIWCLVTAEKAWPAQPELPRAVSGRGLKMLMDAGLVALGPRHTYALLGHDAERTRRSEMASQNATLRWNRPKVEGGKTTSRRTRFKVLERDGYRCRYCGKTSDDIAIDVDHVVPVREGGSDDLDNLVAACVDCNSGKSGHPARAPRQKNARALLEPETEQDENSTVSPPPPVGKRSDGTNPRALGTNPRANGTAPRQERERVKRDPTPIHVILERARRGPQA